MLRRNILHYKYLLLFIGFSLVGFGCARHSSPEKVAVRIGDHAVTVGEFNEQFRELEKRIGTPMTRAEFLDILIDRKLLLQEAERMGLDRDESFLKSIQRFWELSLLQTVIDKKTEEISGNITVSDRDIAEYYHRWSKEHPEDTRTLDELDSVMRWQLLRERETALMDAWIAGLRDKTRIRVDKKAIGIE